jgi:hypothetical protein
MDKKQVENNEMEKLEKKIEKFGDLSRDQRLELIRAIGSEGFLGPANFKLDLEWARISFSLLDKIKSSRYGSDSEKESSQKDCESILIMKMNELYNSEFCFLIPEALKSRNWELVTSLNLYNGSITDAKNGKPSYESFDPNLVSVGTRVAFWFMVEKGSASGDALYRISFGDFGSRIDSMSFDEKDHQIIVVFEGDMESLISKKDISKYKKNNLQAKEITKLLKSFDEVSIGDNLFYYDYRCGWINATIVNCFEGGGAYPKRQRSFTLRLSRKARLPLKWSKECQDFFATIGCLSQVTEQEDIELPDFVEVDSFSPALSLHKHVMYSTNANFTMSHQSKVFRELTGCDIPCFAPQSKSNERVLNGNWLGLNKFITSKSTAGVFIRKIFKEQFGETYIDKTVISITSLLDNALHSERDLLLGVLITKFKKISEDKGTDRSAGNYIRNFKICEILFRRVFPAKQAAQLYFSMLKLMVKNPKECEETRCSGVVMFQILEIFRRSKEIGCSELKDLSTVRSLTSRFKDLRLNDILNDDLKETWIKILKGLISVKPVARSILDFDFIISMLMHDYSVKMCPPMIFGDNFNFRQARTNSSKNLLSSMISDLQVGLRVFSNHVTDIKLRYLNYDYLKMLIKQNLKGVEKRNMFEGIKSRGAFSDIVLYTKLLSKNFSNGFEIGVFIPTIIEYLFSFEDTGVFLNENDFWRLGRVIISSEKCFVYYFKMKDLIKCVFKESKPKALQFLYSVDKLIRESSTFKFPAPDTVMSIVSHLFKNSTVADQPNLRENDLEILGKRPSLHANQSRRVIEDKKRYRLIHAPIGNYRIKSCKVLLQSLSKEKSALSTNQILVLKSIKDNTKLYLHPIRAVLKGSDGFFADQTVTPSEHGQYFSVIAVPDILRIYIHTSTALKGSHNDSNSSDNIKSHITQSVDSSKFQIERSSLISSVRGSISLQFGTGSSPTLMAELFLSSDIDAEVPESYLVKSRRNLYLSDKVRQKTLRIRIKGNRETTILLFRLRI